MLILVRVLLLLVLLLPLLPAILSLVRMVGVRASGMVVRCIVDVCAVVVVFVVAADAVVVISAFYPLHLPAVPVRHFRRRW